jgi:hypothetical protein
MTIRNDESKEIYLRSIDEFTSKKDVREYLLMTFIGEDCQTKLRYFVETIGEQRIYIERPGRLNKGCDFVIYIENEITWNNRNDKPPTHDFVLSDLQYKKSIFSTEQWVLLIASIRDIYEVKPFDVAHNKIQDLPQTGLSYELILKLLRWFFIEQDITYWAGTGRDMLFNEVLKLN